MQIFHQVKYDLKGHFCVVNRFRDFTFRPSHPIITLSNVLMEHLFFLLKYKYQYSRQRSFCNDILQFLYTGSMTINIFNYQVSEISCTCQP